MAKLDTEVLSAPNPEKEFLQAQRVVTYLKALEKEGYKASDIRSFSPIAVLTHQVACNIGCTFPPKVAVITSGRVASHTIQILPGVVSLRCRLYSEFVANVEEFTTNIRLIRPHDFLVGDSVAIGNKTFRITGISSEGIVLNEAANIGAYMPHVQLLEEKVSMLIF